MLVSTFTGIVLQFTGSYVPLFVMAGSAYLLALLAVQLLAPALKPKRQSTKFPLSPTRFAVCGWWDNVDDDETDCW